MFLYFRNCYVQKITFRFLIQYIRDNTADLSTMYRDLYIITLWGGEVTSGKIGYSGALSLEFEKMPCQHEKHSFIPTKYEHYTHSYTI